MLRFGSRSRLTTTLTVRAGGSFSTTTSSPVVSRRSLHLPIQLPLETSELTIHRTQCSRLRCRPPRPERDRIPSKGLYRYLPRIRGRMALLLGSEPGQQGWKLDLLGAVVRDGCCWPQSGLVVAKTRSRTLGSLAMTRWSFGRTFFLLLTSAFS